MNIISTRAHGIMDYIVGLLLVASPWIFNLDTGSAEGLVPMILGIGSVLYSLFTDYEMSVANVIPMRTHLWLDELAGVFLAASPWLFNFDERVYLPHLIIGIAEVGVAIMTRVTAHHVTRRHVTRHRHAH